MSREVLALRYAEGIYSAKNCQNSLLKDVEALESIIDENDDFVSLITVPTISAETRLAVFHKIHEAGTIGTSGLNILKVLNDSGRLQILTDVLTAIHELHFVAKGEVHIHASFAIEPTEGELSNLKEKLSSRYGNNLKIHTDIDKSLLAGFRVSVGNEIYDSSLTQGINDIFDAL